MKIGLFFGSFNPIHTGHLIIAEYVSNYFTDKVWFVVSPQNPFKNKDELLDVNNRLLLAMSAIRGNKNFKVSDIELGLPTPSYTIDTLTQLKKKFPTNYFSIIMGSDTFLSISKWKSSDILLSNYNFLIYQRPSFKIDVNRITSNITLLNAPLINLSSTLIRKWIKEKKSIRYVVPESTLKLIYENKFYF
ncbi:MAG TPA: nicotinate (nicotinamide) nucleotide adenylyltransferase [Parafilimonas sp.]|nr:nicotinate (nicotinamide) nucleotide adenylyltransferase [Parafilimonas sp.]